MKDRKSIAIVPGSFDPITYGHISLVKYAAERYDTVYLAVMINDQKQYLFSLEEREYIAKLALEDIKNAVVVSSRGMLWKLAEDLGADAIVKGYRNQTDYDYELKMAEFNLAHNPNAPTVLIKAEESLEALSSTQVRGKLRDGEAISEDLPPKAECAIRSILKERKK